jgi:hypothetical protein
MVHADKEVRAASTAAKDALKQMFDATYLRMQLYQVPTAFNGLPHTRLSAPRHRLPTPAPSHTRAADRTALRGRCSGWRWRQT